MGTNFFNNIILTIEKLVPEKRPYMYIYIYIGPAFGYQFFNNIILTIGKLVPEKRPYRYIYIYIYIYMGRGQAVYTRIETCADGAMVIEEGRVNPRGLQLNHL